MPARAAKQSLAFQFAPPLHRRASPATRKDFRELGYSCAPPIRLDGLLPPGLEKLSNSKSFRPKKISDDRKSPRAVYKTLMVNPEDISAPNLRNRVVQRLQVIAGSPSKDTDLIWSAPRMACPPKSTASLQSPIEGVNDADHCLTRHMPHISTEQNTIRNLSAEGVEFARRAAMPPLGAQTSPTAR